MTDITPPRSATSRYYHFTGARINLGAVERFSDQLQQFGVSMNALAQQHRTWIASGQTASKPSLDIYNQTPQSVPQDATEAAATVNDAMERLWDIRYGANLLAHRSPDWLDGKPDPASVAGHEPVTGTDGDDVRHVYRNVQGGTGAGDDTIYTYNNSTVDAGAGNDKAVLYSGKVDLGEGDDHALLLGGTAHGGDGHDQFTLAGSGMAYGGTGDDRFLVMDRGYAYGEEGDDHIEIVGGGFGSSGHAYGGEGNDTIISHGAGWLYGGAGDDRLTGRGGFQSRFNGGTGADTIDLGPNPGQGYRIEYNKGDGDDVITGNYAGRMSQIMKFEFGPDGKAVKAVPDGPPRLMLSGQVMLGEGIRRDEVQAERVGDDVRLSFGSAGDSITFKNYQGSAPLLRFADGGWLDIRKLLEASPGNSA
jgi:hypothetical protein